MCLTFASPWIIIRFKYINQKDATVLQVYCLTFMYGSTCIGRLSAHHQERTTAIGASGFTVGAWRLERCWSWSGRPPPTTLQPPLFNVKTRSSYCSCMFLMMSWKTPETCWAIHKRQVINLWNCCILLVDLFESLICYQFLVLNWLFSRI